LANSLASLPIPTEPLVNVGTNGLTVIANASGPTRLFVTGSGLFKGGAKPEAFVHTSPSDKNGTRVDVQEASMGLLTILLPPTIFPDSAAPKICSLSLGFKKGMF